MRHSKKKGQINRFTSWRKATLKSMARSLVIHQSIKTTLAKAKAAKPLAENLISLAKDNTLFAKRQAYEVLGSHSLVKQLFEEIGPRFSARVGGYTRIINLGARRGDNAKLAILELTEIKKKEVKKIKKEKEKAEKALEGTTPEAGKEKFAEEKKPGTAAAVKEKPSVAKKPTKKFLGGLRNIFKKERDSL